MKVTRLRLALPSHNLKMVASRITVRIFHDISEVPRSEYHTGFVYRHMAAGLPEGGLYAKYDVGNDLGKGSFATVRRAIHRESGKWFAVKMIEPSKATKHGRNTKTSTFAREISIMEKLEHPNICKLVEVFVQDDNSISKRPDFSFTYEFTHGLY
jgi:serine/threonine protein kinase